MKNELATHFIIISSNYVHIRGDCSQIFICLPVAQVARAENLLYFTRNQELLKLER